MRIIAHRGAGGQELENSLSSITAAFRLDVDAIEFDIHRTADGILVVMHDATTGRTAETNVAISDVTFEELRAVTLRNGQAIPTLEEVLAHADDHHIYIDIKEAGCAAALARLLKSYPRLRLTFVSFLPGELQAIRKLLPGAETYIYFRKSEYFVPRPRKMVAMARQIEASGIAIDKFFLNRLLYRLARRYELSMYTYSIDTALAVRIIRRLYPGIDIATKHPERINRHLKIPVKT